MSDRPILRVMLKHVVMPTVLYSAVFSAAAYSLLPKFFSEFWGDRMDALQNAWNLWWVRLALSEPATHPSIWRTSLLHWPAGTTLVGHTLGPFNSTLGVPLQGFLSVIPTYNLIMAISVLASCLSMYWLAYYLTRSRAGAILAGLTFGLSNYTLMHLAAGQMNVVSMEWVPVFVLCWHVLLKRPGIRIGVAAALALWLVALTDYYYLLYCILTGALMLGWQAWHKRDAALLFRKEYATAVSVFTVVSAGLVGRQIAPLVLAMRQDPFVGAHDPAGYSLDLLALLVPGRTWVFHEWTQFYWSRLVESVKEGEAYLALPIYACMAWAWVKLRSLDPERRQQLYLWSSVLGLFFLLALGPVLHVAGAVVWTGLMPYTALVKLLPFVGLSGIPARMTLMVVFAASILAAFGFGELWANRTQGRMQGMILIAVLAFQMVPAQIPTTSVKIPEYIKALAEMPEEGGVINLIGINPSVWLYYQTVHGKPIGFGYISRVPSSVAAQDRALQAAIEARDLTALRRDFHVGYVIAAETLVAPPNDPQITVMQVYERNDIRVYRLGCLCETTP